MTELTIQIIYILALIIAVMIHEISHGYVALLCGDTTARDAGRLSLNPIRHVDPIGTVILPLMLVLFKAPFLFGWAKPVPVNLARTLDPRQAMWLTAIAGPASNMIQALVGVAVYHLTLRIGLDVLPVSIALYTLLAAEAYVSINIVLMTFNMIPVPPLDGSRIVTALLPRELAVAYMRLESVGFILIILLINLNVTDKLIFGVLNGFM